MTHLATPQDSAFAAAFENCELALAQFDHRGHLRLAYTLLCSRDVDAAEVAMRTGLIRFLAHHGVPASKFHATLTRAWLLAVAHFMAATAACASAAEFVEHNSQLLDADILLSHYSRDLLFSEHARDHFVAPDLQSIPPGVA